MTFEPRILGMLCNWCSYAGADLAGTSRMQYPSNIRVIRVMCSGRVDPVMVVEAFIKGVDGVFIGGCHFGDCHYQKGNYQAERRVKMLKKLLPLAKIEPERLHLAWISAAEGQLFAGTMKEFAEKIKKLGPSPTPLAGKAPNRDILALKAALLDQRLRTLAGKEFQLTEEGNVYGEKIPQNKFDEVMEAAIVDEYARQKILQLIKDKAMSVKELSKEAGVSTDKVLKHMLVLERRGLIAMASVRDNSPLYIVQRLP